MGGDSLGSGGGQVLEMSFQLETEHLYALGILLLSLTWTLQTEGILQGGDQGELALVAESASEVIQINGPDHSTSEIVLLKPLSLVRDKRHHQQESFYFLEPRAGPAVHWRGTPYLHLEALHIVITNPFIALIGVGYILRGVPLLSGSIFQEGTDLQKAKRFKILKYDLYGRKHIQFFLWFFHFMRPVGVFLFLIMVFHV